MKKNNKILIIEDDKMTNSLICSALASKYENIYKANDGAAGIEMFKECAPDIIITDLVMPLKNGYKMITEIREADGKIPVIVVTAYKDDVEIVTKDVDAVFIKPILVKELINKIEELI